MTDRDRVRAAREQIENSGSRLDEMMNPYNPDIQTSPAVTLIDLVNLEHEFQDRWFDRLYRLTHAG